jgi:hypothetical protein
MGSHTLVRVPAAFIAASSQLNQTRQLWLPCPASDSTFFAPIPGYRGTMTMPYTSSHPESHSFERSMPLTGAGDERAVLDLTRTSAEIHGLIVAFLYAHKADPQEPQLTQATCDLVSIKVVNQHSEHLWKSFETLAQQFGFDMPALIEIGNMYKDAKGLREAGVFAFRDIRSGTGLAHLGPIFAVVSLSYIISLLLVMQCIEQTDVLLNVFLDVQVWSDAIQDDGERAVFVFLVQQLWPQTLGGIEYRPAPQGPSLPGIGYAWQCQSLYGTRAFKVIDGFLHHFGSLLHLLSGGSSVNPSQFLGFRESESHILKMIQVRYVDPRGSSRIFMSSQACALLAVARKLVGLGYLQSFEEVQRYMITVGKVGHSSPLKEEQLMEVCLLISQISRSSCRMDHLTQASANGFCHAQNKRHHRQLPVLPEATPVHLGRVTA